MKASPLIASLRSLGLLLVLTIFGTSSLPIHAGQRQFLLDLGVSNYPSSTGWNNLAIGSTGAGIAALRDAAGNPSTVSFQITDGFWQATKGSANKDGTTSSTLYPAPATRDSFFIGTLSGSTDNQAAVRLGGLNNAALYNVTLYASRMTSDAISDRTTIYTINGTSKNLQVRNNINDKVTFTNVKPVSGIIDIMVTKPTSSIFGYLGIIDVLENIPPNVILNSLSTTSYTAGSNIPLSVKATDADGSIKSVSYYHESTLIGTSITSPFSYTWNSVPAGSYTITAKATDTGGATTTSAAVSLSVKASNVPPAANAGTDKSITLPVNSVTLCGSGTDSDGSITAYNWSQVSGPSVATIASPSSASTAVSSLIQGSYTFRLKVADNVNATATDDVVVNVLPALNVAPTANAGADQTINMASGSTTTTVTLSGSGSDSDGSITAYQWSRSSGPNSPTINNPNSSQTSVSSLIAGTYTFTLKVTDNAGASTIDSMIVTVNSAPDVTSSNIPPKVYAGPDATVSLPATSLTLHGLATDVDGKIVNYQWSQVGGPTTATISSASATDPYITGLALGSYTFALTAKDNLGGTSSDTVVVNVVSSSGITIPPIDESKITRIFVVNPAISGASDINPGTEDKPLKTITAGVNAAEKARTSAGGVKVKIYPGIYRESVNISADPDTVYGPLVLEGTQKGKITITGSDRWTGWALSSGSIYSHGWTYNWGVGPEPYSGFATLTEVGKRRELICVNGEVLEQVLTKAEMVEGTFCIDQTADKAYIWPFAGTDVSTAQIEVSVRDNVFKAYGIKGFVMRNINVEHDGNFAPGTGASVTQSTNVLVEDCSFSANNWYGFSLNSCKNSTLRRIVCNHNGGGGLGTQKSQYLLCEDIETSYNNWRGYAGGLVGVALAGQKNLFIHNAVFRRIRGVGNYTRGFWFDTNNRNITMDQCYWANNLTDGIFVEKNDGPITIQNSIIANNGANGIKDSMSGHITVQNNILYGNNTQISLTGPASYTITTYPENTSLVVKTEYWTIKNNIIQARDTTQILMFMIYGTEWPWNFNTLACNYNTWYNAAKVNDFSIHGKLYDLPGWRTFTGQDANSSFSNPKFVDPNQLNFNRLP